MKEISSGSGNSQYGTFWANNGKEAKKFKKDEILPEGWSRGRSIIDKSKRFYKKCKVCGVRTYQKLYCEQHPYKQKMSEETKLKLRNTLKRKIENDPLAFSIHARKSVNARWTKKNNTDVYPLATNELKG